MTAVKLKTVCRKIGSGSTPRGGKDSYSSSGTALIRSQNVLDMQFSPSGLAFINDSQAEKLKNVSVGSRDVLLNITGDSVARVCVMNPEFLPARVNQHVSIIRTIEDVLNSRYLLYFLQARKQYLLKLAANGSTRNALTKEDIGQISIELLPLQLQEKLAFALDVLQEKIQVNNQVNDNLVDSLEIVA